jgi:hypothetical protein
MSIHKLGSTPKLQKPTVLRTEAQVQRPARTGAEVSSRPNSPPFSRDVYERRTPVGDLRQPRRDPSVDSSPKAKSLEPHKEKLDGIVDKLAGETNLDTRGKLTKAVANLFKEQGLPKWAIRDTVDRILFKRNDDISIAGGD